MGGDYLFYSEHQRDEKYRLPNGSWLLAMSGATTGKVAKLTFKAYEKYYQNQRVGYFQIQKDTNYNFIGVLVSSNLFLNQLKTVLVSGAQPNISSKDVDNFEFNIPSELSEQAKIGILFQFLDNLITVNQRKNFYHLLC
ncbi:Type I restriction modification DNA specificity domain-containing protein [Leuconostocaceae bacterium R-53105]|uniref:Type I restriction modification DNA specificity protein n=1 Tax=Convivina intestini TaxID=1505726 RepID=A0A2U1D9I3_9LACO|nr:type I restriction modification DNA specificity protein [Convivina intestini]SDB94029.1 Type I restriction modification DNA specificity domain-containing protein [Leuconostocaceae bacterium R-53105]